ncbi:hypothetical protein [Glycomyces terrestris]|uniref:Uncharacterized protein n=1 Tax=Glycomyces terrestris TaxID=2493553 RepID=A0A426URZ4_9ACTN|nr:hypothetical protein [Glycomyces terrestris]RRR96030.1 hypothetical protein EIW28_22455 [Glycomyces terrestris]
MSEQQSGAGYPQQPTSGQPGQPYAQAPYASPQAQYQAQQQYAAYAPPAPSLFDRLGVPSLPAILGLSGLGALALSGLITGTSDSTELQVDVAAHLFGFPSVLTAVIVMFALALFAGERLRPLWKALTLAGAAVFLAGFLYDLLSLPDGSSGSDASAWIGALLLIGAYALFVAGALMVPGKASPAPAAAPAAPAAAPGYPTGQQPAVPPAAAPQTQQNQWPQAPQQ